jgi:magnesium-transporting ATPase (P-type)
LFFHGRYSLERNSYYSYFYFFKNVAFTLPQFWLVFFSGFSGLNFYDDWYYLGFNSFLTVLPIAAWTLLNEDIDMDVEEYPQKQIIKT